MSRINPAATAHEPAAQVAELLAWLERAGAWRYDEAVTQLEHALQCAHLAERAGDSDAAVAAALLHDVGHLLQSEHDGREDFLGTDLHHEAVGADWLAQLFPAEVCNPVREHVRAKRFLCSVDPAYLGRLSRASIRSFEIQGAAMSADEIAEAQTHPGFDAALLLRRRDDGAKVTGRAVPGLEHYRSLLESLVQQTD